MMVVHYIKTLLLSTGVARGAVQWEGNLRITNALSDLTWPG